MGAGTLSKTAGVTVQESTLGIVAALPNEARCLGITGDNRAGLHRSEDGLLLYVSGVGPANARKAAELLVDEGANALAVWGVAGALTPDISRGALVLPKRIVNTRREAWAVASDWHKRLHDALVAHTDLDVRTGDVVTSTTVAATARDKLHLQQTHHTVAVDMESAAVAAVAAQAELPFIVVRSIADDVTMELPSSAFAFIDEQGRLHALRGLLHWARHPGQTAALLQTARAMKKAQGSLDTVAAQVGPRLLLSDSAATNRRIRVSCQ